MPPATLVRCALPPILATMMSCFGPQAFLHRPIISMGTASASVPVKTVHAVPVIPGFSSEAFMIWTGPVFGGVLVVSACNAEVAHAAKVSQTAAILLVILNSGLRDLIV